MRKRVLIALSFVLVIPLAAGSVGAGTSDRAAGSTARAYGLQILVPGEPSNGTPTLSAPQDAVQFGGAFAYPADGTVASAASATLSVSADSGTIATATASTEVTTLNLFNGEITADSVSVKATGTATPDKASGDLSQSTLTNLVVLGQQVTATPNLRVQLADWGYAIVLEQTTSQPDSGPPGFHGFVTALDVHLTADHGGLTNGSEILVGYAEANLEAPKPPPIPVPPTKPVPGERPVAGSAPPPEPKPTPEIPAPVKNPPNVTPKLTAGGYVFPVYGPASYTDTFGAFRGDVSGGWHHGDDIFAPLGAPLLAVADGVVFSVGPNRIGGNRLWLQDDAGNQFYYAHLSAYTPLARNGTHVHAGDVLGFVGNTGDAAGGPYHLHFEVHPASLLFLGYDGAVDPTPYLDAWRHLLDVHFPTGVAWAPQPLHSLLPPPGAMLLQSTDISTASGLDPASLERALRPHAGEALLSGR